MPNYDYECLECGDRFEVFQRMNDEKLTQCPLANCDGKVKRLLGTGGGIIFKGSGFYQTDYRSSSYKSGESADKAPSKEGGDGAKKAESKEAPKKSPSGSADK